MIDEAKQRLKRHRIDLGSNWLNRVMMRASLWTCGCNRWEFSSLSLRTHFRVCDFNHWSNACRGVVRHRVHQKNYQPRTLTLRLTRTIPFEWSMSLQTWISEKPSIIWAELT